jgi:hypothetical protein
MRVGDKIAPLHHPIFKPANLPDFLAVARKMRVRQFFAQDLCIPAVPLRSINAKLAKRLALHASKPRKPRRFAYVAGHL